MYGGYQSLQSGLERRFCIVSVAAEKVPYKSAQLWLYMMGWRQRSHEGTWTITSSTLWMFTRWKTAGSFIKHISDKMKYYSGWFCSPLMRKSITTSATWHSGAVGVLMSHQSLHSKELYCLSLLPTVTQSWTLNCMPGFHADTECTIHGRESQLRKNSQSWRERSVASSHKSSLFWCEQWAPQGQHTIHLSSQRFKYTHHVN